MNHFAGTTDELLAVVRGENLEEYRAEKQLRNQLEKEAKRYRDKSPGEWPKLCFNWDLNPLCWHKSFDGWTPHEVEENYPNGLTVGKVRLAEFDEVLCLYSKRRDDELWSVGSKSKLSLVIAHLSHGYPISPVVVGIATDGQICLHGGNHRYTAAKFAGETEFPFLCDANDGDVLNSRLTISWLAHNS